MKRIKPSLYLHRCDSLFLVAIHHYLINQCKYRFGRRRTHTLGVGFVCKPSIRSLRESSFINYYPKKQRQILVVILFPSAWYECKCRSGIYPFCEFWFHLQEEMNNIIIIIFITEFGSLVCVVTFSYASL